MTRRLHKIFLLPLLAGRTIWARFDNKNTIGNHCQTMTTIDFWPLLTAINHLWPTTKATLDHHNSLWQGWLQSRVWGRRQDGAQLVLQQGGGRTKTGFRFMTDWSDYCSVDQNIKNMVPEIVDQAKLWLIRQFSRQKSIFINITLCFSFVTITDFSSGKRTTKRKRTRRKTRKRGMARFAPTRTWSRRPWNWKMEDSRQGKTAQWDLSSWKRTNAKIF